MLASRLHGQLSSRTLSVCPAPGGPQTRMLAPGRPRLGIGDFSVRNVYIRLRTTAVVAGMLAFASLAARAYLVAAAIARDVRARTVGEIQMANGELHAPMFPLFGFDSVGKFVDPAVGLGMSRELVAFVIDRGSFASDEAFWKVVATGLALAGRKDVGLVGFCGDWQCGARARSMGVQPRFPVITSAIYSTAALLSEADQRGEAIIAVSGGGQIGRIRWRGVGTNTGVVIRAIDNEGSRAAQ
jgi:hypothetical protein